MPQYCSDNGQLVKRIAALIQTILSVIQGNLESFDIALDIAVGTEVNKNLDINTSRDADPNSTLTL